MFYKYRNCEVNGKQNQSIKGMLFNGDLFFSKPSGFKDFHDCEVSVIIKGSDLEVIQLLRELDSIAPGFSKQWISNPQGFANIYNTNNPGRSSASEKIAICCLCKSPLVKQMWDNYAINEGICIGYKTTQIDETSIGIGFKEEFSFASGKYHYLPFANVKYEDTGHPKINRIPSNQFQKKLKEALLTKDRKWSYENEVRSFAYSMNLGKELGKSGVLLHCYDDYISEITFSCNIKDSTIDWVESIINSRSVGRNGVKFYKIKENHDVLERKEVD